MSRRRNLQVVPEHLTSTPADAATVTIDWGQYGSAYVTPAGDGGGGGTLTVAFTNKVSGQSFDLWLDLVNVSMSPSVTLPSCQAPTGTAFINTSGSGSIKYHYRFTYLGTQLFGELIASAHN